MDPKYVVRCPEPKLSDNSVWGNLKELPLMIYQKILGNYAGHKVGF